MIEKDTNNVHINFGPNTGNQGGGLGEFNMSDRDRAQIPYVSCDFEPAPITDLESHSSLRDDPKYADCHVATCSGYMAPGHAGHYELCIDAFSYANRLVVAVNSPWSLINKTGYSFMDLDERAAVMSYVTGVSEVVREHIEDDASQGVMLETLKPHVFAKGGDRAPDQDAIPVSETSAAENYQIHVQYGVGGAFKMASSSDFLRSAAAFARENPKRLIGPPTWQPTQAGLPSPDLYQGHDLWSSEVTVDDIEKLNAQRIAFSNNPDIGTLPTKAPVLTAENFDSLRNVVDLGKIAFVSGSFSPVTSAELQRLAEIKEDYDTVVVLVENDHCAMKRCNGLSFMDQVLRTQNMQYMRVVDFVIPDLVSNDYDLTAGRAQLVQTCDGAFKLSDQWEQKTWPMLTRFAEAVRNNANLWPAKK